MAKFINKKEQVYDLKLTSYGRYLLSSGEFKPVYYGFFDDNIIYDSDYARASGSAGLSGSYEPQNDIITRIRESQYIESLTLFEDLDSADLTMQVTDYMSAEEAERWGVSGPTDYFEIDVTPEMVVPRKDNFVYSAMIGDAYLEGDRQKAPAWKTVALNGTILSSSLKDIKNDIAIPQVNIQLNYALEVASQESVAPLEETNIRNVVSYTSTLADGNVIQLVSDDLLIYCDELNTALLTENFDIEVFEIKFDEIPQRSASDTKKDLYKRKYFSNKNTAIRGGLMKTDKDNRAVSIEAEYSQQHGDLSLSGPQNTEARYYFDILVDEEINTQVACKAAGEFNRDSYYIDIDFDCDASPEMEEIYVDIYGKVTEPEVCL